jgi:rhamnulokinase
MTGHSFVAIDLGAESGRTILGRLEQGRLTIKEMNRFPNGMLDLHGHLHWNIFRLYEEMIQGLKICATEKGGHPESVGIDTWGVDFSLLASDGSLLGLPYAYRDRRTDGAMESFFERLPRDRVYELTGIQFLQFNSLFQLHAMQRERSPILDAASDLLFMPDTFNYLLTGEKKTDFTFATTSQLYNPRARGWEGELFDALGVSQTIMQEIVAPGTVIGGLRLAIAEETGTGSIPVVAVASHDTGSAVASVPAEGADWAYISSGTWSLMGVEAKEPLINSLALELEFTNEGGVQGTIRFLKNIMGLWLLQQCRKAWMRDRPYSYDELIEMAEAAPSFAALVDPDCSEFLNPPDMPEAIAEFCSKTGQSAPASPAAFARCILESLALKYRTTLDQLRRIHAQPIERIHIIGGGSQNSLLCQFTANATGVPVLAGPVEATAVGNLMVQALALGHVRSLAEIRDVVRQSFEPVRYEPQDGPAWDKALERFRDISNSQDR